MIETMLSTHSILNYIFIVFLIIGFAIPAMVKEPLGFKKASYIYTMVFQGIITMILFSGIVALIVGEMPFNMPIIVMIGVFAVMMAIEISRHKGIKKLNLEEPENLELSQSGFFKANVLNLIVVLALTFFMYFRTLGA
jgi:hypothetical protein